MGSRVSSEYRPDAVSPPGETLLELLEERGLTQADLAASLGRPRKTINEIVRGKAAITPETALQLEAAFGTPAAFWLNREQRFREHLSRLEQERMFSKHLDWVVRFPYNDMAKHGWVQATRARARRLRELLSFFEIASPENWESLVDSLAAQFRQSNAFEMDRNAVAAWLKQGERQARDISTAPYDERRFRSALRRVRPLTRLPAEEFRPDLVQLCAESGVVVTFVPSLPKSRVWGATRWLSSDRALIQLSLRYKTDDHLWFSFFHEAGHILLHPKKTVFLDGPGARGRQEEEADRFACNTLIPPDDYASLKAQSEYSRQVVVRFANEVGIAPGVVVGRLQHDGMVPYSHLNNLKRRFAWSRSGGTS